MGHYDFDRIIDRKNTSCLKYDFGMQPEGTHGSLPMWVADMDFALPEEILADFHKRIDHGSLRLYGSGCRILRSAGPVVLCHHGYHIQPEWVTLGCGGGLWLGPPG